MTNLEAIETIKSNYPPECYTMLREALDISIGLLENQIPKKPIQTYFDYEYKEQKYECPICHEGLYRNQIFCDECGQIIDWE